MLLIEAGSVFLKNKRKTSVSCMYWITLSDGGYSTDEQYMEHPSGREYGELTRLNCVAGLNSPVSFVLELRNWFAIISYGYRLASAIAQAPNSKVIKQ